MTRKHAILYIIGIMAITGLAIYFGRAEIVEALSRVALPVMALLLLLQLITLSLTSFQWQLLINKNEKKLSLGRILAINMAGNYVESVTPSVKLGGEAAKIFLFNRHSGISYAKLTAIMIALKFYSLLPFLILIILILGLTFLAYDVPVFVFTAFLFLAVFFTFVAWLHFRKADHRESGSIDSTETINRTEQKIHSVKGKFIQGLKNKVLAISRFFNQASEHSKNLVCQREIILLTSISAIIWLAYPLKVYLVSNMLGLNAGFLIVAVITYTAYLVSMVPLLPGGLGSFEATMALMFSLNGFSPAEGLAVALLSRLITYWFPLLFSAFATAYLAYVDQPLSFLEKGVECK